MDDYLRGVTAAGENSDRRAKMLPCPIVSLCVSLCPWLPLRMCPAPASGPGAAYEARLAVRRLTAGRLDDWDRRLSWVRGALVIGALVLGWLVWRRHLLPGATLLLPLALFLVAMVAHDRVTRRRERVGRAIRLYERGLARLDDRWDSQPEDGSRFLDPRHPYAADLDLFGRHSLFQLLCTARTAGGEATLARWLLEPAAPQVIRDRQAAVTELRPRLDLREALWIAGHDVRAGVDAGSLSEWGRGAPLLPWTWMRPLLFVMSVVTAVLGVGWIAGRFPAAPAALAIAVVLGITTALNRRTAAVVDAVVRPETHLTLLAELIRVFEVEFASVAPALRSERLRWLHQELMVDGRPASGQIAHLGRLARVLAWQHNQVFAPIGYALLWRSQFAFAIEAWRRRNGRRVSAWIDALSELETLGALATLAYDHPDRPFPHIEDGGAGPLYAASALRHPLLAGCVPNDVRLGGDGPRLVILSGSNMSGKSTLMRTVGVNAVLALAGAPVRAAAMTLSPLVMGGTLRIQDSLVAGTSRFYAEVTRLRQLVDLARGPPPSCFSSTRSWQAPTPMTGGWAPSPCCGACSISAPSALPAPMTWP